MVCSCHNVESQLNSLPNFQIKSLFQAHCFYYSLVLIKKARLFLPGRIHSIKGRRGSHQVFSSVPWMIFLFLRLTHLFMLNTTQFSVILSIMAALRCWLLITPDHLSKPSCDVIIVHLFLWRALIRSKNSPACCCSRGVYPNSSMSIQSILVRFLIILVDELSAHDWYSFTISCLKSIKRPRWLLLIACTRKEVASPVLPHPVGPTNSRTWFSLMYWSVPVITQTDRQFSPKMTGYYQPK